MQLKDWRTSIFWSLASVYPESASVLPVEYVLCALKEK